jgi:hypothetical protein
MTPVSLSNGAGPWRHGAVSQELWTAYPRAEAVEIGLLDSGVLLLLLLPVGRHAVK